MAAADPSDPAVATSPIWPVAGATALLVASESWFVARHFLVVIEALREAGLRPVVATRLGRDSDVLERAGCTIVDLDLNRRGSNPLKSLTASLRIRRLVQDLDPALVHVIALKTIATSLPACLTTRSRPTVVHLTGVGLGGIESGALPRLRFATVMRLVAGFVSRPEMRLVTENPNDRAVLERHGARIGDRHLLLGGAGVDPAEFPQTDPPSEGSAVRLGFVGRLVWSKGLDVLVEALELARRRGVEASLSVFGAADLDNPRSVPESDLDRWRGQPGICLHGHVEDIPAAWAGCDIAVVPSRGGEGLPRSLLEAAAAGRPLIVTDVPGCRDFARHGIEGFVVAPDDAAALAAAIAALAADPALRRRMGAAARQRVLAGYTTDAVRRRLVATYRDMLARR